MSAGNGSGTFNSDVTTLNLPNSDQACNGVVGLPIKEPDERVQNGTLPGNCNVDEFAGIQREVELFNKESQERTRSEEEKERKAETSRQIVLESVKMLKEEDSDDKNEGYEEIIQHTLPEAEVVLETVDEDENILQVDSVSQDMVADGEMVEEIIQAEEGENIVDEGHQSSVLQMTQRLPPLQIKLTPATAAARGRKSQIKYKVITNDNDYQGSPKANELTRQKVDKDDPRSRLHFVKYMKRDGKTLKIWECGICTKEFRHQYTLMRHLPTHTDERNFKCQTCGKAFRQMSTLSQHRAIHSDARPYVCEFCKKTFNRVSTLISHRKTHSENKPHKCQVCGKGFHQKGNLRNHIFTHTNERPYKCEMCGKGFNQMSNLMCHKAHAHSDKSRYICNICNKEFPKKFALRSHEEYKHGIKYRAGERRQELDPETFKDIVSRKQRRRDEKNLRIIHLANGDRTLADIRDLKRGHIPYPPAPVQRLKITKVLGTDESVYQDKSSCAGVIIDPIETKAMQTAKQSGQTPFALLKPARGIPVLVKVMTAPNNKQMLVPATAEDLKSAGKITVSPNFGNTNGNSVKAVQIKVPVVATVIQKVGEDGQLTIQVEPPGPEQEPEAESEVPESSSSNKVSPQNLKQEPAADPLADDGKESHIQYVREDGTMIPQEELQDLNPVSLLAAAVNMVQSQEQSPQGELLDISSSGVHFVRPSGDGNYELLSQEEAAEMIQQPGHTFEIVSGDNQQHFQIIDESQQGDSLTNQNNLSALVDAIRSAGYQVTEGQKQIVITDAGDQMVVGEGGPEIVYGDAEQIMLNEDGQPIEMVIEEDHSEGFDQTDSVQYVIESGQVMTPDEVLEVVTST